MTSPGPSTPKRQLKRAAEPQDEPGCTPSAASSATATLSPRKRRRIHRPEQGSLYDIMHEHAGTSLFVRPICWTDLHTKLLGARFVEQPPCDQPTPSQADMNLTSAFYHTAPSAAATTLGRELTALLAPMQQPFFQVDAIKAVLNTLYPETLSRPQILPELSFHFGGRRYRDVARAQLLWNRPLPTDGPATSFDSCTTRPLSSFSANGGSQSQTDGRRESSPIENPPILAYIGRTQLAALRRNLFRVIPGPNRSPNHVVASLQRCRAKLLVPADPDHDPHFLGIFLAMAQRHFYTDDTPCSRGPLPSRSPFASSPIQMDKEPEFHNVTVQLLTHDVETADFIVYTAVVTAACLELFHKPTKCSRPASSAEETTPSLIEVVYRRVPIWPILGLKERLGKALGREVVGDFDEGNIEMWQDKPASQPGSLKRKKRGDERLALAEVLNRSFEEDSDGSPVLGAKRPRLERTPLGVVR